MKLSYSFLIHETWYEGVIVLPLSLYLSPLICHAYTSTAFLLFSCFPSASLFFSLFLYSRLYPLCLRGGSFLITTWSIVTGPHISFTTVAAKLLSLLSFSTQQNTCCTCFFWYLCRNNKKTDGYTVCFLGVAPKVPLLLFWKHYLP